MLAQIKRQQTLDSQQLLPIRCHLHQILFIPSAAAVAEVPDARLELAAVA